MTSRSARDGIQDGCLCATVVADCCCAERDTCAAEGGGDRLKLPWRRSQRPGLSSDARLLIAGQGIRAAGYGFTAVLLGALLAARGYGPVAVGVVLTMLIAGTALASLAV